MKRRIIVELNYDPNGMQEKDIDTLADMAIHSLFSNGAFTQHSPAEIDSWKYVVEDPEDLSIKQVRCQTP